MKTSKLYDIFSEIEKKESILIFDLPDIISEKSISNYESLPKINSVTSQYFGTGRYEIDIKVGREFNILFSKKDPKSYIKTKAVLKYISFNRNIEVDYLPAGYSGICLIDFPEGKPTELLNNLCELGEDKYEKNCDVLYLTTEEGMNEILKRLS